MLNPQQAKAVYTSNKPCLVIAGAGSGKTRVITEKIRHLLQTKYCLPEKIFAVTFTNKSAKEMQQRLAKTLKNVQDQPFIGTFHRLGLTILREHAADLGRKKYFSIFDAQDAANAIKELMPGLTRDDPLLKQTQWTISGWKSNLLSPADALNQAENNLQASTAKIYADYEQLLLQHQAFDFDDLIAKPVELLTGNEDIKFYWQNKLAYLLVDECQDTNGAQYALMQALIGKTGEKPTHHFTVVGDDDQSIYAWRGAQPENLLRMKEDYPALQVIKLEQNYRSSNRILKTANELIKNNAHVFDKNLWSEQGDGERVYIMPTLNAEDEAARVVGRIQNLRMLKSIPYHDMAVLYRSNHQARMFEKILRHHQIPYHLSGGTSFFDRTEVRDLLGYLRVLANPDDNTAFLRIVNTPRRQIGHTTIQAIHAVAEENHCSLMDACMHPALNHKIGAAPRQRIQVFSRLMRDLKQTADSGNVEQVLDDLLERTAYSDWTLEQAKNEDQGRKRQLLIVELFDWIRNILKKGTKHTLGDVLNHLALMNTLEKDEDDQLSGRVQLMTLHAAKGLEFPFVYLVGMEEGVLPHQNSIDEDSIEEERRLAYVGITRAKAELTISYSLQRNRFGETSTTEPSRFLKELPEDCIYWEGKSEMPEEERQEMNNDIMADIEAMLAG